MKTKKYISDPFLEKRIVNYDKWLSKGQISASSKVIPISESLSTKQWVLPSEQVMKIFTNANSVAVQDCECRTHYKKCDKPLEVCFLLNKIGDKFVSKGEARHVSLTEVADILKKAKENGDSPTNHYTEFFVPLLSLKTSKFKRSLAGILWINMGVFFGYF
jgi:hypothetical protein